jgi:hypothetical protein
VARLRTYQGLNDHQHARERDQDHAVNFPAATAKAGVLVPFGLEQISDPEPAYSSESKRFLG